jgi:hypothetical protein
MDFSHFTNGTEYECLFSLMDKSHNDLHTALIYSTSYEYFPVYFYQCSSALLPEFITVILKGRVTHLVITPPKFLSSRLPPLLDLYLHHINPHNNTNVTKHPTMSTPPVPKRRRVEPLGIHKPFVSPLKRNTPSAATSTPAPSRTQPVPSTPYTPLRSSNLKTSTPLSFTPQDPEIVQAQQVVKNLEARIRGLRSENGILSQAVQITGVTPQSSATQGSSASTQQSSASSSTHDKQPRLIRLTQKWQKASQLAAEEVFTSFAQQIKDNGGYTTFLAQQKQQNTTSGFYNDDDRGGKANETNEDNWRDEDGDVLTERGKRQRRGEIEERACEKEAEEGAEEEEEQELSLGTMLQVLNIDPEVIGWDTKTLAWK